MRVQIFSPLIILLASVFFSKAIILLGKIAQPEQEYFSFSLLHSAYANENATKPDSANEHNASSSPSKDEQLQTQADANRISSEEPQEHVKIQNSTETNLTGPEFKLLKELAQRRQDLDKKHTELQEIQKILQNTENRIDQKIADLKAAESQISELMNQYSQKEQDRITSLAKIYENMKPKDAAAIFNELDMPILLKLVASMKEVKVAPVIASMNPNKARDLSTEMLKEHELPLHN